MTDKKELVEDFLENDDPIRGQEYCCLSFISPEKVIRNKDVHFVKAFLRHLVQKNNVDMKEEDIQKLDETYEDFIFANKDKLEKAYYEKNNFQTTVRGVKVRGVYDTLHEAQTRAKSLQRRDRNFDVFVGQVGFWLPWDPSSNDVDKQEYFESELNELVHKYQENKEAKDDHFRENVEYVKEQAAKRAEEAKEEQRKQKEEQTKLAEKAVDDEIDTILNDSENVVLDDELKKNLDEVDPWMARKMADKEPSAEEPSAEEPSAEEPTAE